MTTPRPTPFPATTPRAGVLVLFVIIFDPDDEITTLPVRPAPSSPDRTSALYGYPLDSGDDSSDEDLSYRAAMDRLRVASPSTYHPLFPSEILSLSSPPPLLTSSSLPPPSLLSSSSHKRSKSPSPSPPPAATPLPPPPPEHIESVGDDIKTLRASLASAMQLTMTLRARVGLLK
ncbi:hypothetical protein Tco_0758824 [Tanacetum coccineum]